MNSHRFSWLILSVMILSVMAVKSAAVFAMDKIAPDQIPSNITEPAKGSKDNTSVSGILKDEIIFHPTDTGESGIGRPGYRLSPISAGAKSFHDSIQRKIANGESLNWTDRLIIRELQILRQWPVPPQLTEEQKKFVEYINGSNSPLTFTEKLLVNHLAIQGLWPDGKDIVPEGTDKAFIDYYNSLAPENLGGVAVLKKIWQDSRGVAKAPQQKKEVGKGKFPPGETQNKESRIRDVTEQKEADEKSKPAKQNLNQKIEDGNRLEPVTDVGVNITSVKSSEQIIPVEKQDALKIDDSNTQAQEIQLVITNVQQVWQVASMKQLLREQVKGVTEIIQRSFISGIAIFDVLCNGDSQRLAEELTLADPGHFKLKVLGITPNQLDVKLIETDS